MKELSIEEKAKAYDEALERAKGVIEQNPLMEYLKKGIEYIFPELVEPEDEKTRKEIIKYIEGTFPNEFSGIESKNKWIAWLEKQGKQKSTDKVEPKFYEGDWIIYSNEEVHLITGFDDNGYFVDNEHYIPFNCEGNMRFWSIEDAKDCDVLVDEDNNIGIYKEIEGICWHSYIYLGCDNCLYGFNIGGSHKQNSTKPATKEQRDLLFQKMKEAGYEWNANKKELRKTEQNPTEWSEEDEHRIKDTIYFLETTKKHYDASTEELDACIDWLKSIKYRVVFQPKEWDEDDDAFLEDILCKVKSDLILNKNEKDWLKSLESRFKQRYWTEEEIEPIISDYLRGAEHYGGMIGRLRCLKPKSYWKPSDEQMVVLELASKYERVFTPKQIDILIGLKEQLKKL